MFNFELDKQLLIQAFGFVFIALGMAARLGYWKKWYWQPRASSYGYIPYGCIFVLYSYNEQLLEFFSPYPWITYVIYAVLFIIGLWFSINPPGFMKPSWIRWIEKYPANIIDAMRIETKNDPSWEEHIKDEAAVDGWAKLVKTKKAFKKHNIAAKG